VPCAHRAAPPTPTNQPKDFKRSANKRALRRVPAATLAQARGGHPPRRLKVASGTKNPHPVNQMLPRGEEKKTCARPVQGRLGRKLAKTPQTRQRTLARVATHSAHAYTVTRRNHGTLSDQPTNGLYAEHLVVALAHTGTPRRPRTTTGTSYTRETPKRQGCSTKTHSQQPQRVGNAQRPPATTRAGAVGGKALPRRDRGVKKPLSHLEHEMRAAITLQLR